MPIPGETKIETEARRLREGIIELLQKNGMLQSEVDLSTELLLAKVKNAKWRYADGRILYTDRIIGDEIPF